MEREIFNRYPILSARLYGSVCDMFNMSTQARDVCRDGLVLVNLLYARGYREPALHVRDWLQGMDKTQLVSAMVLAKSMGLRFALDLLLDINVAWVEENTDTALHRAVFNDNVEMTRALLAIDNAKMKKLMSKGEVALGWLNAVNKEGMTPLGIAASRGSVECLKALLKADADVKLKCKITNIDQEESFINFVSREGMHLNLKNLLQPVQMDMQNKKGYSPIQMAILNNHPECVSILLSARVPLEDGLMHRAALINSVDILKILLDAGICLDDKYNSVTPLHTAAAFGAFDCLQFLIDHNVDVNAKSRSGTTALHLVVQRQVRLKPTAMQWATSPVLLELFDLIGNANQPKQAQSVQLLVKAGANINALDHDNNTPAHWAAWYVCPDALSELMKTGADLQILNTCHETSLHAAVKSRLAIDTSYQIRTMELLLKAGVNKEQKDDQDHTALYVALKHGKTVHVQMLVNAGADVNVLNSNLLTNAVAIAKARSQWSSTRPWLSWQETVKKCATELVRAGADTSQINPNVVKLLMFPPGNDSA